MSYPLSNVAFVAAAVGVGVLAGLGPFEAPPRDLAEVDWADVAGEGAVLVVAILAGTFAHRFGLAPATERSIVYFCGFFVVAGILDLTDEFFVVEGFLPGFVENAARLIGVGALAAAMAQLGTAVREAELERELFRERSHTDSLTGLQNRAALDAGLRRLMQEAAASSRPLSAIFIDIDDFKQINDNHGHAVGDEILRVLADVVRRTVRGEDEVFRIGGEEVLVLLAGATAAGARHVAERIRRRLPERSRQATDGRIAPTVSIGIAEFEPDESSSSLLERADRAMYVAKRAGKDQVAVDV